MSANRARDKLPRTDGYFTLSRAEALLLPRLQSRRKAGGRFASRVRVVPAPHGRSKLRVVRYNR